MVNCLYEPYSQAASDGKPGTRARLCLYSKGVPILIKNLLYGHMNLSANVQFKLFSLDQVQFILVVRSKAVKWHPCRLVWLGVTFGGGEYRAQLYRTDILPAHSPTLILSV